MDAELNVPVVPLLDHAVDDPSGSELASTKYSLAVESKESSRRKAEREGEVVWGAMRVRRVGRRTRVGRAVSMESGGRLGLGEPGVDMSAAPQLEVSVTVGCAEESDTQGGEATSGCQLAKP